MKQYFDYIPYALGSIVQFRNPKRKGKGGMKYLINDISYGNGSGARYSIIGHAEFKTEGMGSAWHDHESFNLVSAPTIESWNMLASIEDDEDDDNDNEDGDLEY